MEAGAEVDTPCSLLTGARPHACPVHTRPSSPEVAPGRLSLDHLWEKGIELPRGSQVRGERNWTWVLPSPVLASTLQPSLCVSTALSRPPARVCPQSHQDTLAWPTQHRMASADRRERLYRHQAHICGGDQPRGGSPGCSHTRRWLGARDSPCPWPGTHRPALADARCCVQSGLGVNW